MFNGDLEKAHHADERTVNQPRIQWRTAAILVVIIAMHAISPAVSLVTFPALALWALRSPHHTIQSLFLLVLLLFLNPGLFPTAGIALRWLVIIAAAGRVLGEVIYKRHPVFIEVRALSIFVGVAAVLSAIASYAADVSLTKLGIFWLGAATILFAFRLDDAPRGYWWSWLFTFFSGILVLGTPLHFFGVGRLVNGTGFQGIASHPQAYAALLAPFVAWLAARVLFHGERSRSMLLMLCLGLAHVYLTEARTAVFAIILGAATLVISMVASGDPLKRAIAGKVALSRWTLVLAPFLIVALILNASTLADAAMDFLKKRNVEETSAAPTAGDFEAVARSLPSSREALIEASFDNFKKSPLTGIGFGVASHRHEFVVNRLEPIGLPLGAPTEKGFLPSALLEETGLVGATFFLFLLVVLLKPIRQSTDLSAEWMFYTTLFTTLGEMTIFSFGGLGTFVWLVLAMSRARPQSMSLAKRWLPRHAVAAPGATLVRGGASPRPQSREARSGLVKT